MSGELQSPRRSNPGPAVALAMVSMTLSLAIAAAEPWHQLGPAGPGSFRSVVVDPQDPLTMYAASPKAGIFKSANGGESGELLEQAPRGDSSLRFHPADPSVLYFGFSRSEDGGATWVSLSKEVDPPIQNVGLRILTLDPVSPQILFAAGYFGIFRSLDGGQTWHGINSGLPLSASGSLPRVQALAVDALNPMVVYAGLVKPTPANWFALFRSVDRGENWEELYSAFTNFISQIVVDPSDSATVYATSRSHVHRTLDGGNTWTVLTPPGTLSLPEIVLDPNNLSTILAPDGNRGPRLWKSNDQGTNWASFETPEYLQSLTFDAASNVVYAATRRNARGLYQSWDLGESWIPFGSEVHDKTINQIRLGPEGTSSLYALGEGFFRSLDGGGSWVLLESPLSRSGVPGRVTALTVDPVTPALYAGVVFPAGGGLCIPGMFVSLDEGDSWDQLASDFDLFHLPSTILVDPWDPSTLYVGTEALLVLEAHLYRSIDAGESWNLSLELDDAFMVPVIDPLNPSTLYVGNGIRGSGLFDNGFMKTVDSGETWVEHSDGLPPSNDGSTATSALAIDAVSPDNLVAATDQGIYKTTDGAQLWWQVDRDWPDDLVATDLLIDPLVSSTIYAATRGLGFVRRDLGVLRSVDGGVTWTQFNEGLTTKRVLDLDLDAQRRILSAGTDGGGVFARFLEDDGQEAFAIFADPNPIRLCGETARATRIMWHAPGIPKTQVRVVTPDGPLFARSRQQGAKATGNWLREGMEFFLLRSATGEVLAQTTVRLTNSGCEVFSATPNPISVCEGSVGVTTLSWFSVNRVEIRVASLTGKLMARGGPVGSAETGNWVRDGMQFFLLDRVTDEILGQVQIEHTRDGCSN